MWDTQIIYVINSESYKYLVDGIVEHASPESCRSVGTVNVPVVEGYERGGGDRGRRAQRVARVAGSAALASWRSVTSVRRRLNTRRPHRQSPPEAGRRTSRPTRLCHPRTSLIPGFSFVQRWHSQCRATRLRESAHFLSFYVGTRKP